MNLLCYEHPCLSRCLRFRFLGFCIIRYAVFCNFRSRGDLENICYRMVYLVKINRIRICDEMSL